MSARSNSYILLACNLIALIFGGVVTFAIFITVLTYVSIAIDGLANQINNFDFNNY